MKTDTNTVLTLLTVAVWIIFVGLCIKAGTVLFMYGTIMIIPEWAKAAYREHDLLRLYEYSWWYYTGLSSFLISLSGLKAYVFYLVIVLLQKLNLTKPFSEEVAAVIARISYHTFSVGLIGVIAGQYMNGLTKRGFDTGDISDYWADSGAFLMMAGVVFVIAQIFRKGIDLQTENELTV